MNNNDKLNKAFDNIDSKYIEKTKIAPKKTKHRTFIIFIAAIITLLAIMLVPILQLTQNPITLPTTVSTSTGVNTEPIITEYNPNYTPPEFPNAKFSMSEIDTLGIIPGTYSGTQNYQEIRNGNIEYLYLDEVKFNDSIDIYEIDYYCADTNEDEFLEFINKQKNNIEKSYGEKLKTEGEPEIKKREEFWGGNTIVCMLSSEYYFIKNGSKYLVTFLQYDRMHRVYIKSENNTIHLGNDSIELKNSMNDKEILSSVENVRSSISSLFSFEIEEIKMSRGVDAMIYLYGSIDSDLNSDIRKKVSDCVSIHLDNYYNYIFIDYNEFRVDPNVYIKKTDSVKMLSLEMAEELLENGYCFGGHTCRKCMQNNALVDFSEYDYLGIEYLYGEDYLQTGNPQPVIPFYVFYKKMTELDFEGNVIYAKTYVPAIEISGLKEHFDNLKVHKS